MDIGELLSKYWYQIYWKIGLVAAQMSKDQVTGIEYVILAG